MWNVPLQSLYTIKTYIHLHTVYPLALYCSKETQDHILRWPKDSWPTTALTHPLYFPSLSPFSLLALILGFPIQNNPCAGGDNDQPCDDGDSHVIQSIRAGWCMGHVCIFKQISDKTKIGQINLKVIRSALEMAVLIIRMTLKGHLCGSVC